LEIAPKASEGRIVLNQASTLEQMGQTERAIESLQRASQLIGRESEPRLAWVLSFNLATCLCALGRHAEASLLLPEVKELAREPGRQLDRVRILWLEGKIASGLGKLREALISLAQVRRLFFELKIPYDYALVTLELAALLLQTGHVSQLRRLAGEVLWIFDAEGVPAEALRALTIFRAAVERDRASLRLSRRLLTLLERARKAPANRVVS